VIERVSGGENVGWFPDLLERIATHPSGRVWAGTAEAANHLYMIKLEGEPKQHRSK
jgi:hypothetical protein